MPAYNAEKTLEKSWSEIPHAIVDEIILTDDSSVDNTVEIAQKLGIQHVIRHDKNLGYGGNQKSCYKKAIQIKPNSPIAYSNIGNAYRWLCEYEKVHILNISNGSRLETYVIKGFPDSGEVCINGAAAHLVSKGDLIIIVSYCSLHTSELEEFKPSIVYVDSDNKITGFQEKPLGADGWVNGGYYVVSPKALDYIEGDKTQWEGLPLGKLEQDGRLSNFPHHGFWHLLDTLRDKVHLEELWNSNKAPWKSW